MFPKGQTGEAKILAICGEVRSFELGDSVVWYRGPWFFFVKIVGPLEGIRWQFQSAAASPAATARASTAAPVDEATSSAAPINEAASTTATVNKATSTAATVNETASAAATVSEASASTPSAAVSKEFHHAFAMNAGACVHLETLYGENSHHIAESGFKALARAVRQAVEIDAKAGGAAPSTKGVL